MKVIAGDIGGTKTILRLVEVLEGGRDFDRVYEAIYKSKDFPDLVPMVKQFLAGKDYLPEKACFALAGPVVNNTCKLTNLNWLLDSHRLEQELGIEKVILINDFAAISYGILSLAGNEIKTLQVGSFEADAPIAVIGAGTGLGEGFLVPSGSDYQVFGSEGGHVDFSPRNELEWELLQYLQGKYQLKRVSVERVVSGQGIVAIYQFLRDRGYAPEAPTIKEMMENWEKQQVVGEIRREPAEVISMAALQRGDRLCEKTLSMFVEAYGAEAGNLALKLLPGGGVYIAGGIAGKILPLMEDGRFISVFKEKGRLRRVVEQIPVHVVLNPQVGLLGSVRYAVHC
ncbi:MAG: glucokinase [Gomphosphaeria aponina SAG 52.96 = DSM 107014]|uniref:Glucokinase n=1 Tax=Gomphosphaeria aponina SAG 52.96 = DSM 107014 TaxID=1521640 RepID=A0A941GTD6_9CHRO|nr:glucokinase [Gomphosphaeria aponina SAG 52.96 = DSM 107014]